MITSQTSPLLRHMLRPLLVIGVSAFAFTTSTGVLAAPATVQQFQQWSGERWISRSVGLAELGFASPAVLDSNTNRREFYLPVPANVPLSEASLQLNAHYLRADGGRTSMMLAVDGYPVAARKFEQDQGDASQTIGIDGLPRASGFVRVAVNWSSVLSDQVCTDQRAPGNALRIAADSRFSYRYDRSAITSLSGAWSALPVKPVLLVGGRSISAQAYDTAWRTGVALERNGRHVVIRALPAVGETIDVSTVEIPAALLSLPAFVGINDRQTAHRIKDNAELGALLALGDHGPLRADLVVSDAALKKAMQDAFDALQAQVASAAPDATAAYSAWIAGGFSLLKDMPAQDQLRLVRFGGNPVIAIDAATGPKAGGLLGGLWQTSATGGTVTVRQAALPKLDGDKILLTLLSQFGAVAGTMDVLSRTERAINFDLSSVAVNGRLPDQIAFDLSAAPSINGEAPVASIFLNDFLLGAQRLTADGKPQRMLVDVPAYTLAARNEIRIAFFRQPTQVRCHDQPTAFPVSILPGSHIRLSKTSMADDFVGTAGSFSGATDLLVPQAWLSQADTSLPQIIRIADASGFSTDSATLQLVKDGQAGKPAHPFLAFDVALGDTSNYTVSNGKLTLRETGKPVPMLDLEGIDGLATAEVIKVDGQEGIVYRNVGKRAPAPVASFRMTRGNLAVIGDNGLLLQIDTNDPTGSKLAEQSNPQSLWVRHMTLWLILIGVIAFVLISARVTQVRRRRKSLDNEAL